MSFECRSSSFGIWSLETLGLCFQHCLWVMVGLNVPGDKTCYGDQPCHVAKSIKTTRGQHTHTHTHPHIHTHTHTHTHTHPHTHTPTHTHTHTHPRRHTHTHTHTHPRAHTHTPMSHESSVAFGSGHSCPVLWHCAPFR